MDPWSKEKPPSRRSPKREAGDAVREYAKYSKGILNYDPLYHMLDIALKAENQGNLGLAFACHREIAQYVHRKFRLAEEPSDPSQGQGPKMVKIYNFTTGQEMKDVTFSPRRADPHTENTVTLHKGDFSET